MTKFGRAYQEETNTDPKITIMEGVSSYKKGENIIHKHKVRRETFKDLEHDWEEVPARSIRENILQHT